jgi:hypothetical protein
MTLTVNRRELTKVIYQAHARSRGIVRPWSELNQETRIHWQRVADAVIAWIEREHDPDESDE